MGIRGLIAAAAAVLLCAFGAPSASALSIEIPPTLNDTTRTVPVTGLVKSVVVRTDMGQVAISAGSSHSIRIRETWNFAKPTVTHSLNNGVLRVTANCPDEPTSFNKCSASLAIVVPSAVTVDAFSNFGDVRTKSLRGSEKLGSDFGDITAAGVSATTIATQTDYGNVLLDLVSAPTNAAGRSSFGDVSVKVPAGTYAVSAKTSYGDVKVSGITRDSDAARRLTAHSSYGDISVTRR